MPSKFHTSLDLVLTNEQVVSFDPTVFESLFPFSFAIDGSLNVIYSNCSLQKVEPKLIVGSKLTDFFTISKPRIDMSFNDMLGKLNTLHTWKLNSEISFQGQLFCDKHKQTIVFVGVPIINDNATLKSLGLQARDFALHDTTLQHLFMLQAQKTAIEDSKEMVNALRQSAQEKARLEAIQSNLAEALDVSCELKAHFINEGTIIDLQVSGVFNGSVQPKEKIGKNIYTEFEFLGDSLKAAVATQNKDDDSVYFNFKYEHQNKTFYFESRLATTSDGANLLLANDVTERFVLQQQLERRANYDNLTGLPNRYYFVEQLNNYLKKAESRNKLLTIAYIDLDNFKDVNSRYGNAAGDYVLREVAKLLQGSTGEKDLAARIGGDEFVVFFTSNHSVEEMLERAQRLSDSIREAHCFEGKTISCECSIGVAFSMSESSTSEALLNRGSLAMQHAKNSGKGYVEQYVEGMYEERQKRLELQEALVEAIEHNTLSINYQPIVFTDTGKVKGFEALARWIHPVKGFIPPDVFIELAESSGLMIPLGRSLMDISLKHFALYIGEDSAKQNLTLALNVSVHQLYDINFLDDLNGCISRYNLNVDNIILEVTETSFIRDIEEAIKILNKLSECGFTLALDDFGTGFSSLSYVERLPFDILKIDRAFINKIESTTCRAPLVKTILGLASELKCETVAEGIETDEQRLFLKMAGCKYSQGYFFSRPLNYEQLEELEL
jgi:diguanylate cyclase (GGDEF)-like protein